MTHAPDQIYYAVADRSDQQIESFGERYNLISEDQIREVFIRNNYKVTKLTKNGSWGTAHIVYFAEVVENGASKTLVFRANAGEKGGFKKPEIAMLSEQIVTNAVRTLGVSTNKIIHVDISRSNFPFDYQIEEVLSGEDPERYLDKDGKFKGGKKNYDRMSFELGEAIAKYSGLKYSGFGLFDENKILRGDIVGTHQTFYDYITTNLDLHLTALVGYSVINENEKQAILAIFEKNKDLINDCESSLVHHDLADHNIMYDAEKGALAGIFDWEAMVLGDPMLDLGSCPTWSTHYPRKKLLIEGYKSIKELPDDYELRMRLYELRTWIWKIVFVIRIKVPQEEINEMIEKMKKVVKELKQDL